MSCNPVPSVVSIVYMLKFKNEYMSQTYNSHHGGIFVSRQLNLPQPFSQPLVVLFYGCALRGAGSVLRHHSGAAGPCSCAWVGTHTYLQVYLQHQVASPSVIWAHGATSLRRDHTADTPLTATGVLAALGSRPHRAASRIFVLTRLPVSRKCNC